MFTDFVAQETGNITDVWVKVKTYSGTWASTDGVINCEVRLGRNGTGKPGTSVVGSFTITLDGSTTGWIKKTGLTIAVTAGTLYTFVFGDADGGGTNYVTLVRSYANSGSAAGMTVIGPFQYSTTDGYATAGSVSTTPICMAMKIAGEMIGGTVISAIASHASNTKERGIKFTPPANCTLVGFQYAIDNAGSLGYTWKLYDGATNPGGTTLMTYTPAAWTLGGASAVLNKNFIFPAASRYNLTKDQTYRFVLDPTSNYDIPRVVTIGGSPDSDILGVGFVWGAHQTDEATGVWTDTTDSHPLIGLIIVPNADAVLAGNGHAYFS